MKTTFSKVTNTSSLCKRTKSKAYLHSLNLFLSLNISKHKIVLKKVCKYLLLLPIYVCNNYENCLKIHFKQFFFEVKILHLSFINDCQSQCILFNKLQSLRANVTNETKCTLKLSSRALVQSLQYLYLYYYIFIGILTQDTDNS